MVYESDFYTTRRPYSRPSPTISSYSVTYDPKLAPGLGKIVWCSPISGRLYYVGQTYHHNIPHVGHMRLTAVPHLSHIGRTRPSILYAEMDRITHKMRPSVAYQPAEDFLNSRSIVNFDDEARSIRAQTAALLKRIYTPVPRARSAMPTIQPRYIETAIPERITSDAYIQRMLSPMRDVQREINSRSYYNDMATRSNIGKGHLACVSYAGGRAFSRRKNLFYPDVDQIKNEVKFLSHYEKTREAACVPQVDSEGEVYYAPLYTRPKRDPNKPLTSRFYRGAVTAPIEPSQRISAKIVASVPLPPARAPPVATEASTVPQVERQTSLKEEAVENLDDMASRLSRKKKKKQEERAAEEMEQRAMAKLAEQKTLEAANEEKRKAEEQRKIEEAKKEAERKAEEERLEAERKAEEVRLAEEARKEAERKAEEEKKEAERKAEEERRKAEEERLLAEKKAEEERLALEKKAEEERLAAEKKAEEERLAAEKQAEEERLALEKKAEEEKLAAEKKMEEERQAEAARQAEAEREEQNREEEEVAAELAGQEAELSQLEAESKETEAAAIELESEPAPEPEGVVEAEPVVISPQTEEPEPTVEEPLSPEAAPTTEASGPAIEEVSAEDE